MTRAICSLGIVLMLAGTAHGAILYLENAADGSASMDLAPGQSGLINLVLFLHEIDTAEELYVNVFLDTDDDVLAESISIIDVQSNQCDILEGPLPITFEDLGIILYCDTVHPPDTIILVTLVIAHIGSETAGSVAVTFEKGARAPQIFTENFSMFAWGFGFAGIIPNFADPGVGGQDNPFVINLVPPSEECDGDANSDGVVDPLDSGFVLSRFGCEVDAGDPDCDTADQNDDGLVDPLDVGFVLARFGTCE